jgi:hypothetical protein
VDDPVDKYCPMWMIYIFFYRPEQIIGGKMFFLKHSRQKIHHLCWPFWLIIIPNAWLTSRVISYIMGNIRTSWMNIILLGQKISCWGWIPFTSNEYHLLLMVDSVDSDTPGGKKEAINLIHPFTQNQKWVKIDITNKKSLVWPLKVVMLTTFVGMRTIFNG